MTCQAFLHLRDFVGADAKIGGNRSGLGRRQPAEEFLCLAQIKEQLALCLGRRDLE